jgi:ribokinase
MIHVIGNVAIDTLVRVDQFPRPGETIVGREAREDLGGKGANQAIMIARCGQKVRLCAAVGDDASGERIRQALDAEAVSTDGVALREGPSDRCVIYVDAAGENTIVSLIDAARSFDPLTDTALAEGIMPGEWVLMQGNLRADVTRGCLALARSLGAMTALNPSPTYPSGDYEWGGVDLVLVNRGEAIELGGHEDPLEAAKALLRAGAGAVALTLGAEGAVLVASDQTLRAPAPRIEAVDTVGAGDVFCGALIAGRSDGRSWSQSLRAATEAASIAVTRQGVISSFPSRAEMAGIFSRLSVMEDRE